MSNKVLAGIGAVTLVVIVLWVASVLYASGARLTWDKDVSQNPNTGQVDNPTPVPQTEPTPIPNTFDKALVGKLGWNVEWYRSPFRDTTRQLSDEKTRETLAEPGMYPGMNGAQTAWQHWDESSQYMLVREAGFTYSASNGYCLDYLDPEESDSAGYDVRVPVYCLPKVGERIYLTIYRGYPSDGGDVDLNQLVVSYDYTQATGIYHEMDAGAYVSLDWLTDQIRNTWEPEPGQFQDPGCGDNGCDEVFVVIVDLHTLTVRIWKVITYTEWQRITDWAQLESSN